MTVVNASYDTLLALLLLTGLVHGMRDPAMMAIIARWAPRTELGRSVSLVFTAPTLANVVVILLFTFLNESPSSWTSIFYLVGNSGTLWCVSWYAFGSPNPNKCFYVTAKERLMLEKNIVVSGPNKKMNVSWPELFKSPSFYGVLISRFLTTWIFELVFFTIFFQTYMFTRGVTYSTTVFGSVIFINAVIPLVQFAVGTIGDKVITHKKYPPRYIRKTFNSISIWGQCVCYILLSYTTSVGTTLAVYIIVNHVGCMLFQGSLCSFFDVDRRLTGLIFGLVNFYSLIPLSFINNYCFPVLKTQDPSSFVSLWKDKYDAIWLSGAFACFIGNFFYIILAADEGNPMLPLDEELQPEAKK
ncbi:hypothetical protein GE061_012938 [Apolygus lucorum]|uniref:Major facilitator superfamily (MFS) profile domain-containing protein n=1 Tax=Apolygus lucorum TaxID=248454 RepID=A0A8S9XXT4_APOLU|nr:hypothetical protein GE061_012938 [Apolygus lucorum]